MVVDHVLAVVSKLSKASLRYDTLRGRVGGGGQGRGTKTGFGGGGWGERGRTVRLGDMGACEDNYLT